MMNHEQCPDNSPPKISPNILEQKPTPRRSRISSYLDHRARTPFWLSRISCPTTEVVGFLLRVLSRSPDDQRDFVPGALHLRDDAGTFHIRRLSGVDVRTQPPFAAPRDSRRHTTPRVADHRGA